jgi:hypothetical protein
MRGKFIMRSYNDNHENLNAEAIFYDKPKLVLPYTISSFNPIKGIEYDIERDVDKILRNFHLYILQHFAWFVVNTEVEIIGISFYSNPFLNFFKVNSSICMMTQVGYSFWPLRKRRSSWRTIIQAIEEHYSRVMTRWILKHMTIYSILSLPLVFSYLIHIVTSTLITQALFIFVGWKS